MAAQTMDRSRSTRAGVLAIAGAVVAAAIAGAGLAAYAGVDHHGNTFSGQQLLIGLSGAAVGAYVAYRRPDHRLGWVLLVGGLFSLDTFAGSAVLDWMIANTPEQEGLARAILHICIFGWIVTRGCFLVLAPLVFPQPRPVGRWMRVLWAAGVAAIVVTSLAHSHVNTFEHFQGVPSTGTAKLAEDTLLPWGNRAIYVLAVVSLASMLVTVLRLDPWERRRHLPVAVTFAVFAIPTLDSLYNGAYGHHLWSGAEELERWTLAALPAVLGVGVLRHGVLDIEVVVRRATVYGLMAVSAAAAYVGIVWTSSLFVQEGSDVGPVVATGLIALVLLPLHAWSERVVDRHVYGNRRDPYAAISALGSRLEQAPPEDEALQLVVETLVDQLRVPFAAIELDRDDGGITAARSGTPTPAVERFPLSFHGDRLGDLVVAHRTDREAFKAAEHDLLAAFARQAGVVAHNATLAQALLESRSVLVAAREAERRRIRRDLHDGLGPTLATVSLSLSAAAEGLRDDPELSRLLIDLEGEIQEAITDIRRLVYDLRPPVLDDLGLVGAIQGQADHLQSGAPLPTIAVTAPCSDHDLPSSVELAAYRVAVEAMTNVVRHANAGRCDVALHRDHHLTLQVDDDGVGIAPDTERGIGLRSMRERVIELGGSFRVLPRTPSGTTVRASFPLPEGST